MFIHVKLRGETLQDTIFIFFNLLFWLTYCPPDQQLVLDINLAYLQVYLFQLVSTQPQMVWIYLKKDQTCVKLIELEYNSEFSNYNWVDINNNLILPRLGDSTGFFGWSSEKFSNKCRAKSLCVFEEKPIDSFLASHISWTSFFNFIRTNPISSFGRPRFGDEAMARIIW